MNKVHVVGGRGYIGSRLARRLTELGYDVNVIDPGYTISDTPDESQDVTDPGFEIPNDGAPVVWLACIHRLPPEVDDSLAEWERYADQLMVESPREWIQADHPIIYVSSMQVVTQEDYDLYADCKQNFETMFVGRAGVRIIRPGTVWGGLIEGDQTNRVQTVVNKWLVGGALPDEHWRAYTTRIQNLLDVLESSVVRAFDGELPGDVWAVTDICRPTVATDITPKVFPTASAFREAYVGKDFGNPPHPMARLARARGLPWKDTK
jgi:nucleoside-diphosphate-sugar epimerase